MSSSIRPPGAPPPGPAGLDGISDLKPGQNSPSTAPQASAPNSQAAAAESPTAGWLRRLSAGEVSKQQAVDGLVAQALEAQGPVRLSPAQRDELAAVLKEALLNDPVLAGLLG